MVPIWREVVCYSVLTELCRMSEDLGPFLPLSPVSSSVSLAIQFYPSGLQILHP